MKIIYQANFNMQIPKKKIFEKMKIVKTDLNYFSYLNSVKTEILH